MYMFFSMKNAFFSSQLEKSYMKDELLSQYHTKSVVTAFRYCKAFELLLFYEKKWHHELRMKEKFCFSDFWVFKFSSVLHILVPH